MSDRSKLAAGTAAFVASERLAEFLLSLEEMEHQITAVQRQEVIQLCLRAFDGTASAIEASLSIEEQLRDLGRRNVA